MFDTSSILPPNRTTAEGALEQAIRLGDPELAPVSTLLDADTCPPELLAYLAWAMSVDEWDVNWSDDSKRKTIATSVSIHRRKGTIGAVKAALAAAGYGEAQVVERYGWEFHNGVHLRDGSITREPLDHWAEYRVILTRPISIEQADQVRSILKNVAPARCHLKALQFTQALNLHNDTIKRDGTYTRGVA